MKTFKTFIDYIEEDVGRSDAKYGGDRWKLGKDGVMHRVPGIMHKAGRVDFKNSETNGKPDDSNVPKIPVTNTLDVKKVKVKRPPDVTTKPRIGDKLPSQVGNTIFDPFAPVHEETKSKDKDPDITEDDLDKMADSIDTIDDIIDVYTDDELALIDDEGNVIEKTLKEDFEQLDEVLSRMERIRAKIRFARSSSTRARKVKIALKRHSSTATINSRARKLAVKLIKMRIAKKPLNKLSVSEKERIDRIIEKRKPLINRLAMKLSSRVRKIENDRLAHKKFTKK